MSTAVVVFAHGSSVEPANEAVRAVSREVARAGNLKPVDVAFLEPFHPTLEETVAGLVAGGATRIVIVPYFLTPGLHLERDLPGISDKLASIHPTVEFRVTSPLDGHPALARIVLDRAREALSGWQ